MITHINWLANYAGKQYMSLLLGLITIACYIYAMITTDYGMTLPT